MTFNVTLTPEMILLKYQVSDNQWEKIYFLKHLDQIGENIKMDETTLKATTVVSVTVPQVPGTHL